MSAQRYIKWSLYWNCIALEALHWNDRNEWPKYEYIRDQKDQTIKFPMID